MKISFNQVLTTIFAYSCQSLLVLKLFNISHKYIDNLLFFYLIAMWVGVSFLAITLIIIAYSYSHPSSIKIKKTAKISLDWNKNPNNRKKVVEYVGYVFFYAAFFSAILLKNVPFIIVYSMVFLLKKAVGYYSKELIKKYREEILKLYPERAQEINKTKEYKDIIRDRLSAVGK